MFETFNALSPKKANDGKNYYNNVSLFNDSLDL